MKVDMYKKYLNDGFEPLYCFYGLEKHEIETIEKINKIILSESDLRRILDGDYALVYRDYVVGEDEYTKNLIKCDYQLHITPIDVINFINKVLNNEINSEDIDSWTGWLCKEINGKPLFVPDFTEDLEEDFFFKNDDNLVKYALKELDYLDEELTDEERCEIKELKEFIEETLKFNNVNPLERNYSTNSKKHILHNMFNFFDGMKEWDLESQEFYKKYSQELSGFEDYPTMWNLAYNYYEGINGYEIDFEKSLYWLKKCFDAKQDPEIARTIGYIYYYGRTTNGVPDKENAFKYFAIGHIAGRSQESTYKLADCYVKGYGTPVCHKAAYTLVHDVYDSSREDFLCDDGGKFADIALRMASYCKEGIYVDKCLDDSHYYILEARTAIKDRLTNMEYIGDRNVAAGIYNLEKDILREKKILVKRNCDFNGYVLENYNCAFDDKKIKFEFKENIVSITIGHKKWSDNIFFLVVAPEIDFSEKSENVSFVLKMEKEKSDELKSIVENYKVKNIAFNNDTLYLHYKKDKDYETTNFNFSKLVLIPKTVKDLEKRYKVVSVEFQPNTKTYDYLCNDETLSAGDDKKIKINGKTTEIFIKSISYLYEDQLPLPLFKIGKI